MNLPTTPNVLQQRRVGRVVTLYVVMGIGLLAVMILAAGRGQLAIPASEVLGAVLNRVGIDVLAPPSHPQGDNALWQVRFPRVVLAVLVGAALATAGALMQGVFGNPLAEPGVVGVSVGSALAAGFVMVYQVAIFGPWTIAVFAFAGGLVTTMVVYLLARADGRTEVVTLVLTGIAVNAVCASGLALLLFLGDTQAREEIVFWQMGSLNGTRWSHVVIVAPLAAFGIAAAVLVSQRLDVLALGDRAARQVGVNVEGVRVTAILIVALLTAAAVAFAGIIAFVGLVIPHLIRMAVGPGHRILVPASALAGAILLVLADLIARTGVAYADLPIGMLTSLVGGPFFFWLIRRTRRTAGGWV